MNDTKKRQLIIGLGTGRSGTTSLTKLLDAQPSSFFVHEGGFKVETGGNSKKILHLLPWNKDLKLMHRLFEILENESEGYDFYGCVALYFLPYVSDIVKKYPHVKFICLVRSRAEVIKSFSIHAGDFNWWMNHDGSQFRKDPIWDPSFPKLNAHTREEAIGKYWDDYFEATLELESAYPNNFKAFDLEILNTPEGINKLLDFAGYPNQGRVLETMSYNSVNDPKKVFRRFLRYLKVDTLYRSMKKIFTS